MSVTTAELFAQLINGESPDDGKRLSIDNAQTIIDQFEKHHLGAYDAVDMLNIFDLIVIHVDDLHLLREQATAGRGSAALEEIERIAGELL